MASLYSMKPKPFMSLISVMSPVPWDAKWASTSALVARDEVRGLDGGGRARRGSTQVEAQSARRLGWGAYHCAAGCPGTGGWMTPRSCLLRSVFQAIRSCNGRDWTGLFWKLDRGEVRRRERNGTGNGSLIVGGRWEVVWFGMLTVATGRGEKCGRGTSSWGAELLGSKVGWRLGGWVWVWVWVQIRQLGQARDAQQQASPAASSSQSKPFLL